MDKSEELMDRSMIYQLVTIMVLYRVFCRCGSDHSQALFTNGIVATQSQDRHKYFVSKLDGQLQ